MKTTFYLFLILLLTCECSPGRAGRQIPAPEITIEAALTRARQALQLEILKDGDKRSAQEYLKNVIITTVEFANEYDRHIEFGDPGDERPLPLRGWYWLVTFTHRIQNDHSWTFKVNVHGAKLIEHSV